MPVLNLRVGRVGVNVKTGTKPQQKEDKGEGIYAKSKKSQLHFYAAFCRLRLRSPSRTETLPTGPHFLQSPDPRLSIGGTSDRFLEMQSKGIPAI